MGAGASGFLLKRAAIDELIQAIRSLPRALFTSIQLWRERYWKFHSPTRRRERTPTDELSDREAEVLRLIAWGYSNKEIANDLAISVKTVETYKARFAEKLDLHSRTAIVRYAVRQGWMQDSN